MKIELWPVDKPQPYARNARKISELAIEKVARSIKEFGWRQPIVVDAEGVVIAGHTRLLAAKSMGEKKWLKGTKTEFRRRQRRRSRGPGTSGCWETTGCSAAIARRAPTSQR